MPCVVCGLVKRHMGRAHLELTPCLRYVVRPGRACAVNVLEMFRFSTSERLLVGRRKVLESKYVRLFTVVAQAQK